MRALVVDDSKITRGLLARILGGCGYETVEEAADGLAALEHLAAARYDLVITDVRMPRLDGLGLLRRARELPAAEGVPFVVVSSVSEDAAVRDAFEAGALNFIRKPFLPASVRRAVEEVQGVQRLRREAREGPALAGRLGENGVVELVQFLQGAQQTGALRLTHGGDERGLAFERGQVVAAWAGALRGAEAFFELAATREGRFSFEPGEAPSARDVTASTTALLLEVMRRADEASREGAAEVRA